MLLLTLHIGITGDKSRVARLGHIFAAIFVSSSSSSSFFLFTGSDIILSSHVALLGCISRLDTRPPNSTPRKAPGTDTTTSLSELTRPSRKPKHEAKRIGERPAIRVGSCDECSVFGAVMRGKKRRAGFIKGWLQPALDT